MEIQGRKLEDESPKTDSLEDGDRKTENEPDLVDEQSERNLEAEAGRQRRDAWRRSRPDRIPRSIW